MRLIDLGEDREKAVSRFIILHSAAFLGRAPARVADWRILGKIQDKLEEASDAVTVKEQGETIATRKLREGVTSIALDDAEVDLLKARFSDAEIPWLGNSMRRVLDVLTVLENAKEFKPELTTLRAEVQPDDATA